MGENHTSSGPEAPPSHTNESTAHTLEKVEGNAEPGRRISISSEPASVEGISKPRLPHSEFANRSSILRTPAPMSSSGGSSDKQLCSPDSSNDRVFPMRSVVSVDSSQTPYVLTARSTAEQSDYFPEFAAKGSTSTTPARSSQRFPGSDSEGSWKSTSRPPPRPPRVRSNPKDKQTSLTAFESGTYGGGGSGMQPFSDTGSSAGSSSHQGIFNSNQGGARLSREREDPFGHMTVRHKHIVTSEGHAVITGRDGETLQRCEDEPIHIPGAIQGFGVLIAMEEREEGKLMVRVASENSARLIGYSPEELFALESFTQILSEEQQDNMLDHVDFIRDDESDVGTNGPEVFTISIRAPNTRKHQKLWCGMHVHPTYPHLIICEFELHDDPLYPLMPSEEATPEAPEDTLQSNPSEQDFAESTESKSRPLRMLKSARKRKGEAAAMEVFNIMSQVQEQLASAPNLNTFLQILVGVVKELTGFHRVMIYQFDPSFNGRVVTELVDTRATKDLYKGLHFPASDIPKQAREMYKLNKVRLLYDRGLETARLVCRTVEDLEQPLDLTFSYLRAMSPIHIKYLENMGVRASMSISINAFNELWGLIACHTYGPKGMRVSFPIRKMCRLVGDTASRNIERLSYASRLQARKLINTVPTEANPSGYIIASSDDLLKLFDADFGLLSIRGETKIMGIVDHSQEILAMLEYLRLRKMTSVVTSNDVKADFPDLRYSPGFEVIAGLLLVPLSVGGSDFIVFFRKGQMKEVRWAGNPYEKLVKEGTEGLLEPRKSFKTWCETLVGKCREWTGEEVETAAVLCLVYGKFIEVWRQKEAALQSSQLTKLLLANSAHEVRTPLNAIINYLEIALEGALDQETRENLAKSHSASKSLIYVINDLLDLTKTEEGQDLIRNEVFDLPATIREAADAFNGDAKRQELEFKLVEHPGLPRFVHGDQRRVRQLISNLTANALQYTTQGFVSIEIWSLGMVDDRAIVEIVVQDSGEGMSNEKLDALFRDLEQVSTDGDGQLESAKHPPSRPSGDQEHRVLGLGLATVARTVRNMGGQLRLKSNLGEGSRFVVQLQFAIPDEEPEGANLDKSSLSAKSLSIASPPLFATEGEVTLIEKRRGGDRSVDRSSINSFRSNSSNNSDTSAMSDVDRLIDALSGPFNAEREEKTGQRIMHRSNSKSSGHSRKSTRSLGNASSFGHSASAAPTILHSSTHKPGKLSRSKSYGAPEHLRSAAQGAPGFEFVADNRTVLKAVRMPDDLADTPSETHSTVNFQKVLFDIPDNKTDSSSSTKSKPLSARHLRVLVAEDDPVNSRIIKKRLEKSGHEIRLTVNGEDCAAAYRKQPSLFDVVLMDIQMPIVDGLTSTKIIRSFEASHSALHLSPRAAVNGRIPIFAVSASLLERERQTYINAGFDGWIVKPIDFKRLNTFLCGIVDDDARTSCLYQPGKWECGGWFETNLKLGGHPRRLVGSEGSDSLQGSESGSNTPLSELKQPTKPLIHDERLDVPGEAAV